MAQYGQNEALTAGMTTEKYSQQLGRLLDELAASGIACVLVSPHELLPTLPPLPSPARFNSKIKVYAEATTSVAQSHGLLFVVDPKSQSVESDAVSIRNVQWNPDDTKLVTFELQKKFLTSLPTVISIAGEDAKSVSVEGVTIQSSDKIEPLMQRTLMDLPI